MLTRFVVASALLGASIAAHAETVTVKYRDSAIDLKHFDCKPTVSSFVNRVCYDGKKQYMLILLKETWYHYCDIDQRTVSDLLAADSKGKYFNAGIKGNFSCKDRPVPAY